MFPKPISWLGMEKLNLTQQNHAFTNQKKYTTTQNKHHTTTVYGPFSGTTKVSRCQKTTSELYGARED